MRDQLPEIQAIQSVIYYMMIGFLFQEPERFFAYEDHFAA